MSSTEATLWTVVAVVLPLVLALAAYVFGRRAGPGAGLVAAAVLAWAAVRVAQGVLEHGPWEYSLGGWAAPLGIQWRVDGLSALMLLMAAAVGGATTVYACRYFAHGEKAAAADAEGKAGVKSLFWPLYLLLWASLNGLFLSADIFNIYVLLEIVTLASVALVALDGSPVALTAALRYLLLAMLGSLAYLFGVALLYSTYAVLDMAVLGGAVEPGWTTYAATGLMTVGLMVKAAILPLHVWLPPAHAAAPAPVSALLSGLVVKAPYYLILRLWFDVFSGSVSQNAAHVLGGLGALAIVWGAYQAFRAPRLKQVIAYSTVSQIGYLFLMLPLAMAPGVRSLAFQGGVLFAVAHALTKASLFLAAGTFQKTVGHDRIRELGGAGLHAPITFTAYGLATVSLIGLPPSGVFAAKWMLLSAATATGQWWYAVVLIVGGPLAAAYLIRFAFYALGSPPSTVSGSKPGWGLDLPALVIALTALLMGFFSNWVVRLLEAGGPMVG